MELISHAWILLVGEDLVDGAGEVARLVDAGEAVLGVEGGLGLDLTLPDLGFAHLFLKLIEISHMLVNNPISY